MKKKNEPKTIKEQIDEETSPMSMQEITNLLYDFSKTHAWKAYQKYNMLKDSEAIQSLAMTDPFKEPTKMARSQGIRIGLYYVEQLVAQEAARRARVEDESKKK